jgi:uncharacterized membrane protein YagU involved in acid resistance
VVRGALSGAIGAACMTPLRLAARRRGVIDKTVSQAAEEWLANRTTAGAAADPALHDLADQVLHAGYGALLGAVYALAASQSPRRMLLGGGGGGLGVGLAVGFTTWAFGSWLLMPLLGAKRPPWRKRLSENAIDLLAHAVFGWTTVLMTAELSAESPRRRPTTDAHRRTLRVG